MNKENKQILAHLVKKELAAFEKEEKAVAFPSLAFLKSADMYERELKKILDKLK